MALMSLYPAHAPRSRDGLASGPDYAADHHRLIHAPGLALHLRQVRPSRDASTSGSSRHHRAIDDDVSAGLTCRFQPIADQPRRALIRPPHALTVAIQPSRSSPDGPQTGGHRAPVTSQVDGPPAPRRSSPKPRSSTRRPSTARDRSPPRPTRRAIGRQSPVASRSPPAERGRQPAELRRCARGRIGAPSAVARDDEGAIERQGALLIAHSPGRQTGPSRRATSSPPSVRAISTPDIQVSPRNLSPTATELCGPRLR